MCGSGCRASRRAPRHPRRFLRKWGRSQIGVAPPRKRGDLVQIEIKIRQDVDLIDDHRAAGLEDERVFERLVVPLRDGEDHQVQMRAGVKFRRTDKIANVLQNDQVEPRRVQLLQPLTGHPGVEMAHAARVQLDDLRAGARDGVRVDVGVDIRLHHAHAQLPLQQRQQTQKRRRLAGAGRGHQVDEICALCVQLAAQPLRRSVVVRKDTLLDLNDTIPIHAVPPVRFSSKKCNICRRTLQEDTDKPGILPKNAAGAFAPAALWIGCECCLSASGCGVCGGLGGRRRRGAGTRREAPPGSRRSPFSRRSPRSTPGPRPCWIP